jgi:hypothetical protein
MKRDLKAALAESIFNAITCTVIDYEIDHDVSIQWEATVKLNGEDFYDFKEGMKI